MHIPFLCPRVLVHQTMNLIIILCRLTRKALKALKCPHESVLNTPKRILKFKNPTGAKTIKPQSWGIRGKKKMAASTEVDDVEGEFLSSAPSIPEGPFDTFEEGYKILSEWSKINGFQIVKMRRKYRKKNSVHCQTDFRCQISTKCGIKTSPLWWTRGRIERTHEHSMASSIHGDCMSK